MNIGLRHAKLKKFDFIKQFLLNTRADWRSGHLEWFIPTRTWVQIPDPPPNKSLNEVIRSFMKEYLGDSVYADTDCGQIVLTTENGILTDSSNIIRIGPEVYVALEKYVKSRIAKELF